MYITDKTAINVVNQLFEKLTVIMPAFKQAWPKEGDFELAKKEWIIAFHQANINTIEQIKRGLNHFRLLATPFVPSPGEFIEWCQPSPEDIGMPSIEQAYKEACLQARPQTWVKDWSHDGVKDAYRRTGNNSFLNESSEECNKKFAQHYRQVCQDYAAGRIQPQIPFKKPFSKTDEGNPEMIGDYDFVNPGVLRQYEHIKSAEEVFAVIDMILGNGNSKLPAVVGRLEAQYKKNNYL